MRTRPMTVTAARIPEHAIATATTARSRKTARVLIAVRLPSRHPAQFGSVGRVALWCSRGGSSALISSVYKALRVTILTGSWGERGAVACERRHRGERVVCMRRTIGAVRRAGGPEPVENV